MGLSPSCIASSQLVDPTGTFSASMCLLVAGRGGDTFFCLGFFSPCRLEYCELTADIVEALNAALQTKPTLKELSLSNNTLGDTAVKQLCRGLVEASCNLELLQ